MKYNTEVVKANIILVIAFMALLFTICFVMYTDIFIDKKNIDVTTNVSLSGGNDALSQELQAIIPYVKTTDNKYVTAYQDKSTKISDVHNDVLLTKALLSIDYKSQYDSGEFVKQISNMYGSNVFIVNESFLIDGENICTFDNDTNKYICAVVDTSSIIYEAIRNIDNISISGSEIYLLESILFMSTEKINNVTYYKIYDNGTYKNIVTTFTNLDIETENISLNEYLNKIDDNKLQYRSKFIINNDNYNWMETSIYEK